MLAARYIGNRMIGIDEVERVPPAPGEVHIAVAYTGLCGTDLHIVHGDMDARVPMPLTFGHEMSGTVALVGAGVEGIAEGDHVTVVPLDWDGTCTACLAGYRHVCQNMKSIGIDVPGSLQGYWNVKADKVVVLPAQLRLDHAALVEPVAVSVHDVRRSGLVEGSRAVVVGGGPIGALIAITARASGAEVVVFEPNGWRRERIAELGFTSLDPLVTEQVAWVNEWTGGSGADVVFEVSGSAGGARVSTDLLKVRGTLVIVGVHSAPRAFNLHRVFWRELTVVGARVYEAADFHAAIDLLASGAIPADALISHIEPLGNTAAAVSVLESGEAMKVLIDVRPAAGWTTREARGGRSSIETTRSRTRCGTASPTSIT